ncbi:MAG: hypothetical protein LBB11_03580 [Puniceicoccales bacterium]|jgi:hypothetical protein|nr:hypothetical protein [Puniceicoccales bacterium]
MKNVKQYVIAAMITGGLLNVSYAQNTNPEPFQFQEDLSKLNTSALGVDVDLEDNAYSKVKTCLAKINAVCAFECKLGLRLLLDQKGKSLSEMEMLTAIEDYDSQHKKIKQRTEDLPVIFLEITDGKLICPHFFNELTIYDSWANNKKITYKSGTLKDDDVQDILKQRNLGQDNILIKNWETLWRQEKLLFFVTYDKKLFVLVPKAIEDVKLMTVTPDDWHTSSTKKAALAVAGTAAVVAAAGAVKTLIDANASVPTQPTHSDIQTAMPIYGNYSFKSASESSPHAGTTNTQLPNLGRHPEYNFDDKVFYSHYTFEKEHPNVIFAGVSNLSYRYYNNEARTINREKYQENYFKVMLDLKYDLDVAENQCNWTAKETIAQELLEIIGKYGSTGINRVGENNSALQEMIDYQDMVTLHAAIVVLEMAMQRKTTEICKLHCNHLGEMDLKRVFNSSSPSTPLDTSLQAYLRNANAAQFKINEPVLPYSTRVGDIIALAKLLCNPKLLRTAIAGILRADKQQIYTSQQDRTLYEKTIINFVNRNFNVTGKEFLKRIATNYFMKTYDKIEHFLRFTEPSIKLKLRDCNGKDIFNNIKVCSYNSALELIRRERANESFIAFGGMFEYSDISRILNLGNPEFTTCTWNCQYTHFNEDGTQVSQQVQSYAKTHESILAILTSTNDLSSRIRAHAAYLVFVTNINHWIEIHRFPSSFKVKVDQEIANTISHLLKIIKPINYQPYQPTTIRWTPLKLLCYRNCYEKVDLICGAAGMSLTLFMYDSEDKESIKKSFFNEITTMESNNNDAFKNLGLTCIHIVNPFASIVGQAGFNNHGRLILQY